MSGQRLTGKVALVTGGASGIGRATGRRFVEHGASVVLADIDLAGARAAASDGLEAVRLDVTDDRAWEAVVDDVVRRYGKLDVLVNSAGIAPFADIETCTTEAWHRVMAVNADSVFFGCRSGVRAMKDHGGSIVNISSVSGLIGGHNTAAYNASKGAVRLLTKSVALHCARKRYGIRCNSVHPTFIETPMVENVLAATRDPDGTREKLIASVPLGRMGKAGEVADMILYLASDESTFVTGAEFVIDGGMTAS
ncbi:MAG: glucose 1-dehydrogenase [Candidatus Eremiobacteraeota bacterium]|nr:glucose 1-dehydrogenase [Candidatus Eremiobacteraeota bacterium]